MKLIPACKQDASKICFSVVEKQYILLKKAKIINKESLNFERNRIKGLRSSGWSDNLATGMLQSRLLPTDLLNECK